MIKPTKADISDIPKKTDVAQYEANNVRFDFWEPKYKFEKKLPVLVSFNINKISLLECLYSLGFRRYDINETIYFIQIVNHRVIRITNKVKLQDFFFNELKKHYKENEEELNGIEVKQLLEYMYNRLNNLFNDDLLYRLNSDEIIRFNSDKRDTKYIYFKNGFIEINPAKITFNDYSKLNGYIWESQILQRDYVKADNKESVFSQFIKKICSVKEGNVYKYTDQRVQCMMSITGYNLHAFTDTKLKATLFTDSRISNDDEPNGRTGKTLYCKGIGYIVCSYSENESSSAWVEINGKDFDPKNKNKYQTASLDTKLIVLNDLKKNFDFEILFNDITEGLYVEKKNQHPFRIKPRLIATTNKTVKLEGSSARDRAIEFEFSDYFNDLHSPQDEFKHWFFTDWDSKEWNRFDNYMSLCCQVYLKHGLIKPESINLNERKLRENTSIEFLEWFESVNVSELVKRSINFNEYLPVNDLYKDFVSIYPDFIKLSRKKFNNWLAYYCKYSERKLIIKDRKFLGNEQGYGIQFQILKQQ